MSDRANRVSWCPTCRARLAAGPECDRCARLRLVGVLIEAVWHGVLVAPCDEPLRWRDVPRDDVLDAIAEVCLLGPARQRRAHTRELLEEARHAQRAEREAYQDGLREGRHAEA